MAPEIADFHDYIVRAHENIRDEATRFRSQTSSHSARRYQRVLQDFVDGINPRFQVSLLKSSGELDSPRHTQTLRLLLIDDEIRLYYPPEFFSTDAGLYAASSPMNAIYFIVMAAARYRFPMYGVTLELNDRCFEAGIGQSSNNPNAILIPDLAYFLSGGYKDLREGVADVVPFEEREAKIYWRGSTTGVHRYSPKDLEGDFKWLARLDLCQFVANCRCSEISDVKISQVVQINHASEYQEILQRNGLFAERVDQRVYAKYKLIIDIDGNSNSWPGLFCSLLTGSCVVKITSEEGFRQWYYDRLRPWEHFAPVRSDFADFEETVERLLSNPLLAQQIGKNGRAFALSMNYEDELSRAVDRMEQLMAPASFR